MSLSLFWDAVEMRMVLDNDIGNGNGVGFRNDNDDEEDDNM